VLLRKQASYPAAKSLIAINETQLLFEKLPKLLQLFLVNVGNSPIVKLRIKPMDKVITLARDRIHYLLCSWPGNNGSRLRTLSSFDLLRSSAGPHASLRRAQPLRRHRLPHNPQSFFVLRTRHWRGSDLDRGLWRQTQRQLFKKSLPIRV
jgi:hypothetical protein